MDASRSELISPNSSIYSRNQIEDLTTHPVDDYVYTVSNDEVGDTSEENTDIPDMDGEGFPLDLSDDLLHMVKVLLLFLCVLSSYSVTLTME